MRKVIIILAILLSGTLGIFLFSGAINHHPTTFNHDELVEFTVKELDYELMYGNSDIDVNDYIDTILQNKLRHRE